MPKTLLWNECAELHFFQRQESAEATGARSRFGAREVPGPDLVQLSCL